MLEVMILNQQGRQERGGIVRTVIHDCNSSNIPLGQVTVECVSTVEHFWEKGWKNEFSKASVEVMHKYRKKQKFSLYFIVVTRFVFQAEMLLLKARANVNTECTTLNRFSNCPTKKIVKKCQKKLGGKKRLRATLTETHSFDACYNPLR